MGTVQRHSGIHDYPHCLHSLMRIPVPRPRKQETYVIPRGQKSSASFQVKHYIPDLPKEYFHLPGSQDAKQALHDYEYITKVS